jgi:hypothetical protein
MAHRLLVAAIVPAILIGCGNKEDESDSVIVTDASDSIEGVLATLPACEPITADGRISVISGCADGICVGMTYDEVVEVTGSEGACEPTEDGTATVTCTWDTTVQGLFDDLDDDFAPDKGDMLQAIRVLGTYEGGTPEGLGIGATSSCFLEQYGTPDVATWMLVYDHYVLLEATWVGWGLTIVDDDGPPGEVDPDGIVDHLMVSGAL